jgi:voltage-gated sodium channel
LTATLFYRELSPEQFGNPARSFYSIFRLFTIEGWHEFPASLAAAGLSDASLVWTRLFFMAGVLICGMLGFSLANAVFIDEMTMDNTNLLESKVDELSGRLASLEGKIDRLMEKVGEDPQ